MQKRCRAAPAAPRAGTASTAPRGAARPTSMQRAACHSSQLACRKSVRDETSRVARSFAEGMKAEHDVPMATEALSMDRRIIRVDAPPAHAGIMAALRRAFEEAASEP